jgi:hypothetical protein
VIGRGRFTRKCNSCQQTQGFALPQPTKTVIYLDQFVLSNISKVLSSDTPATKKGRIDPFYLSLFAKLRRLLRLQLMVCPQSPIHRDESVVSSDYEKLEQVYAFFSEGVKFREPETIRNAQIITVAKRRFQDAVDDYCMTCDFAIRGELHKREDFPGIRLKQPILPGYESALRRIKAARRKAYTEVHGDWAQSSSVTFQERYRDERTGLGKSLFRRWNDIMRREIEIASGISERTDDDAWAFLEPDARLLLDLFTLFRENIDKNGDSVAEVWRFLASNELDAVPYLRISSLLFAALARRAANANKAPDNVPFEDVDMIAAYLPFCDAMFIDREMHGLLQQRAVRDQLGFNTKGFSLRTKSEFLDYLDAIEASAPRQHIETAKAIYPREILD